MNQQQITQHLQQAFNDVQVETVNGSVFFFAGTFRKMPFATLVVSDDFDQASNLARPEIYRLNFAVDKQTYLKMFGPPPTGPITQSPVQTGHDFTTLDLIMPHPIYAAMSWLCVLNPSEETFEKVKPLLAEAHRLLSNLQTKRQEKDV